jgi:hypothetical protein
MASGPRYSLSPVRSRVAAVSHNVIYVLVGKPLQSVENQIQPEDELVCVVVAGL